MAVEEPPEPGLLTGLHADFIGPRPDLLEPGQTTRAAPAPPSRKISRD